MNFPLSPLLAAAAILFSQAAFAQEILPQEKAQELARKALAELSTLTNTPFNIDADADHPQIVVADQAGAMVVPDRGLSPEKIAAVTGTPLPVGQLWLKSMAISEKGTPLAPDKVRVVTFRGDDKEVKVALYLLGLVRNGKGERELVLYGNSAEPLLNVALTSSTAGQTLPIEITGKKDTDDSGTMTLSILGQYRAEFRVLKTAGE